jgi:hypothetical protein
VPTPSTALARGFLFALTHNSNKSITRSLDTWSGREELSVRFQRGKISLHPFWVRKHKEERGEPYITCISWRKVSFSPSVCVALCIEEYFREKDDQFSLSNELKDPSALPSSSRVSDKSTLKYKI